ncbi:MAG: hypothetical protein AAGA77_15955 [Bacteroidota bacterium]
MNSNSNEHNDDFKSADEAFEYLVQQRLDEKRRKEWTEALNTPEPAESRKKKGNRTLYLRIASIAAGVLMIFGATWIFNQSSMNNDLIAQSYINAVKFNTEYEGASRSVDDKVVLDDLPEKVKEKLSIALQNEDYHQLLGIYRSQERQTELPIKDKYYFAISLLRIEKEDSFKAIRLLNEVISNSKILEVEALYFRGLAHLKTENYVEAEIDFNSILKKSDYQRDNITNILTKINNNR